MKRPGEAFSSLNLGRKWAGLTTGQASSSAHQYSSPAVPGLPASTNTADLVSAGISSYETRCVACRTVIIVADYCSRCDEGPFCPAPCLGEHSCVTRRLRPFRAHGRIGRGSQGMTQWSAGAALPSWKIRRLFAQCAADSLCTGLAHPIALVKWPLRSQAVLL
jgi:hypothetical protein